MIRNTNKVFCCSAVLLVLQACSGGETSKNGESASATTTASPAIQDDASSASAARGPLTLTAADLDGFEKGFRREIELVRAAQDRASKATTPAERGEAIQASFEDRTMADAAPASGLSPERYRLVREAVYGVIETLDFQGNIEGPKQMDMTRADDATKARLSGDAYAVVDPAGAALLKSRLSTIVPVYVEYVNLTVVGG